MIGNLNYFDKNIIIKIAYKLLRLFSKPSPDWVETPHNKSFILEPNFKLGYNLACKNIGEDFRIPWRIHQAIWAAHHCLKIEGDFVELGTGKGFVMQSVLGSISNWNNTFKKLWLYDTFKKYNVTKKGKAIHNHYYAPNINSVKDNFSSWKNIKFVEGDILQTIKEMRPEKISFLHVDLNDSNCEIKILEEILPLVSLGGIVLLDDYANKGEEEAYKSHNNFFSSRSLKILTTPSGQGIVIINK
jgi:hypothetical protein